MGFLESLYSIENFGIYLFVVIGILVVLFLIILFFGKKDEKKRKEEKKEVENNSETLFKETSVPTPVEVPNVAIENVQPVEPQITEPVKEEQTPQEEVVPIVEKEFDFDALAAAISKELESI